jgi:branched-chain amino acid transport system substrate-binding protein
MNFSAIANPIRAAGALAVLALAVGVAATPAAEDTVVKVGVILTYSGPMATNGDQIDKGLQLYFDQHQKDLPPGVKIELIKRDDTGPNPEVAKRLAQELVTRDHVQFLTGVVWSPNASAIAPIATEARRLRDLAVGMEECSRRGSNQRMDRAFRKADF